MPAWGAGRLPVGSLVAARGFGTFALLHDRTWHIVLTMALMGVGIGIAYSVMPVLIVARDPATARTASATGVNQVLRLLGGSVGRRLRRRDPRRAHAARRLDPRSPATGCRRRGCRGRGGGPRRSARAGRRAGAVDEAPPRRTRAGRRRRPTERVRRGSG